jgi:hypothetical protein
MNPNNITAYILLFFTLMTQWACKKEVIGGPTDEAISFTNKTFSNDQQVWTNHNKNGVDYIVTGRVMFQSNSSLNIEPGTEIVFENGGSLVLNKSTLHAIGSNSERIIFRGRDDSKGFWKSIIFYGNTDNQMAYCDIRDAGASTAPDGGSGAGSFTSAVILGNSLGDASLSLENCLITNASTYGLYIRAKSKLTAFSGNTITNCDYVAYVTANSLGQLAGSSNQLTGNIHDQVKVNGDQVRDAALWPALPVTFLFSEDTQIENEVSIEPGATLLFDANAELILYNNSTTTGKLLADGTPAKPIIFKGASTTAGFWKGIKINAGLARLTYCNISDAGNTGGSSPTGSVFIWKALGDVNVTIQNSSINNSSSHGLSIKSNTTANVTLSNNLFNSINGENVHYW